MNKYYLPFVANRDIDYLFLLNLWDIADYNKDSKNYDTIRYSTLKGLAEILGISYSTLNRKLQNTKYSTFFTIDKENKTITLNNNTRKGSNNKLKKFVLLSDVEVKIMRNQVNDKVLFSQYLVYIIYYCRLSEKNGKPQNFTAKQFLSAFGYKTESNDMFSKISSFNTYLVKNKVINIERYDDELGHKRNIYTLVVDDFTHSS